MSARLELKRDAEAYFTKKVLEVLDRAYGPGQAIVSVDVTFNQDQVKVTREDVIPFARKDGEITGAVTRRRQQFQGPGTQNVDAVSSTDATRRDYYRPGTQTSTVEVEYENSKKIEQIVTAPGSIQRLSVGVVLPGKADPERTRHVYDLVSMSVGLNVPRGDAIIVHSLDQLMAGQAVPASGANPAAAAVAGSSEAPKADAPGHVLPLPTLLGLAAAALLVIVALAMIVMGMRRRAAPPVMTAEQRQEMLDQIRTWLDRSHAPAQGRT
jgi:flagellar M-ring protein FliF